METLRYYISKLRRKPYFGKKYGAYRLINEKDGETLKKLVQSLPKNPTCLEIGSHAGSSAIIIGNEIKKGSGILYCVDKWEDYRIYRIFKNNIKYSGLEAFIISMMFSSDYFATFGTKFDFIFIDGDHRYFQVKKDIENYLPLLKPGGIMCGHDLELFSHEVDEQYSRANGHRDMVKTEDGVPYHPGVTMAVKDVLNNQVEKIGSMWIYQN